MQGCMSKVKHSRKKNLNVELNDCWTQLCSCIPSLLWLSVKVALSKLLINKWLALQCHFVWEIL